MSVRIRSVTPHLHVPNVVSTAEYYERVLGFRVEGFWDGNRVHHDAAGTAVFGIVSRDGVRLHLNRVVGSEPSKHREDGSYDVYFDVDGVDEFASELRRRGADIIEGPTDRSYGAREVIVRDCHGRIVAFGTATHAGNRGDQSMGKASERV